MLFELNTTRIRVRAKLRMTRWFLIQSDDKQLLRGLWWFKFNSSFFSVTCNFEPTEGRLDVLLHTLHLSI